MVAFKQSMKTKDILNILGLVKKDLPQVPIANKL